VLRNGHAIDAAALNWTAPAGVTSFSTVGDVKLTACTAEGGSTDPVTGVVLCDGLKNTAGSDIYTVFQVMQRKISDPSSYCKITAFPSGGRNVHISSDVHHQMLYAGGAVSVSTGADCSRNFRIRIYVKSVSGSAVVVHRQGTIVSAFY
jgi:hypothetical protein